LKSAIALPLLACCLAALPALPARAEENFSVRIHGQGWSDMGRIMHVTDTLVNNLNGNWQQGAGAQFTAAASIGENWDGAFGFGGYQVYHSLGQTTDSRLARSSFQNFITESRMTYACRGREHPLFTLTFGNFPFLYNPDAKDLGSYLLRGPVYPGILMGGFKDFRVDSTKGNVLGFDLHNAIGAFSHDLIFANEREVPPTGDWSAAYVAKYRFGKALEIGGGVNLYRVLSANPKLTTPYYAHFNAIDSGLAADGKPHHAYEHAFSEGRIDTVRNSAGAPVLDADGNAKLAYVPTVIYTHRGVKLMSMFSLDLKDLLGLGAPWGRNDLKVYGEAAVLGVQNYGAAYNDVMQRIPVMLGVNLPAFGFLDFVSLEVEHYGAKYRNDLGKVGNFNTLGGGIFTANPAGAPPIPSPVPMSYANFGFDADGNRIGGGASVKGTKLDVENLTQDDWKWSLYLEKSVAGHVRFIGQLASDHYRPRPTAGLNQEFGGTAEAFSSTGGGDWYWMFRIGYGF
jgi:hypothetical protein